jgi:hypothetical protein
MAIIRIVKVTVRQQYLLEVGFDNGTTVILNMAARLGHIRFMALADATVFKNVSTDGQFIRWGNKAEISLNEVFQLAQK